MRPKALVAGIIATAIGSAIAAAPGAFAAKPGGGSGTSCHKSCPSPYTWNNATVGTHTIKFYGTDVVGHTSNYVTLTITVTTWSAWRPQ